MVFVSLSCTVSVQETTSLKPSTIRTSLAPQKGPRRSLDVCAHVLATQVASPDASGASSPAHVCSGIRMDIMSNTHWTPAWTKTLQTKFSAVWEAWQKISTQLSQYKTLRPDWVAQTQILLDQHFQRFVSSVGGAATASAAGTSTGAASTQRPATPSAASTSSAPDSAAANRQLTLTPYLTVADDVEISFAAMLSDLCNMAYDVDKLDSELIEARHHLSLIASSLTGGGACSVSAIAAAAGTVDGATAAQAEALVQGTSQQQQPPAAALTRPTSSVDVPRRAAAAALVDERVVGPLTTPHPLLAGSASDAATAAAAATADGGASLPSSLSMLQLTSPEAVTAALTSQGHGAAFAHPVYVSSLHHPFTSMASCDDEGDISDLELRAAAAAAGGPSALLLGGSGGSSAAAATAGGAMMEVGSLGTLGTMGALDYIPVNVLQKPQGMQRGLEGVQKQPPTRVLIGERYDEDVNGEEGMMAAAARVVPAASGTLYSDVRLSDDRDFVTGQIYGYNTKLVERRQSSDGGSSGGAAMDAAIAAVTQSGAAGGRALREEQQQSGRRRRSSSGGGGSVAASVRGADMDSGAAGVADVAAAAAAVAGFAGTVDGAAGGGVLEEQEASPVAGGLPVVVACTKAPPNAWLACDDQLTKTRYFAIQGSCSLEHWQINLQFEPVVFEDPKYGVRVHRGVYEAAKALYDDLLPLVRQHLDSSPYATVSFAGHSLGGSLATVLMLLFVVRGVLRPPNISPVYTFGAPAVFCQGGVEEAPADRCERCTLHCEHATGAPGVVATAASGAPTATTPPLAGVVATAASTEHSQRVPLGLLATLGLSDDHIVNVIMHKDVVPRAFVCDYTALAGMLRRVWPSLGEHFGASDGGSGSGGGDGLSYKSLYNFVGRVAVVRPSDELPFINGPADAAHPMLPNHPALYRVGLPDDTLAPLDYTAASLTSWEDLLAFGASLSLSGSISAMAAAARSGCRRRRSAAAAARRSAKLEGLQKSVLQFMNQPHPLATLSDYQAYGPRGVISRFHNPDNYTRALDALLGR